MDVKVSHQSIVVIEALLNIVVFMIRTWGQDSTTSLREVSSTWGQSDKSKYCKGICFFILTRETSKQQRRNMKERLSPGSPSDELTLRQLIQLLIPSDKPGKGNSSNGRKFISSCCLINRQFKCFEFDYNAHLDIQVVEMVTSGGEVKEAAIGDQGACLDLQLLGCQV